MKIYTRKGDWGRTSLADGTEVSKNDCRVEAYGTLDELNSHIGLLMSLLPAETHRQLPAVADRLREAQNILFVIGAALSGGKMPVASSEGPAAALSVLEAAIDRLHTLFPPLQDFILPGGGHSAAQAHVCRSVCRRAERRVAAAGGEAYLPYLNRLSDFFFLLAFSLNQIEGISEIKWDKRLFCQKK